MKHPFLVFIFSIVGLSTAVTQPEFYMSNETVDDCEGILYDSENGDISGTYDHNENYTFSICIPGANEIIMDFWEFCTEESFDFITIFDGPDTMSTIIFGPHSGEIEPPQIIATSGCLTINFTSDPNVSCTGWVAHWYVEVEEPVPPNILPIADVPCESNSIAITFDEPIHCDSLYTAAFSILGPTIPPISSVSPAPCTGGTATDVVINFGAPLDVSGTYQITFTSYETDECGVVHELISNGNFNITDCPIFVSLEAVDDPVCAGDCTIIEAEVTGGVAGTYIYTWGNVSSDSASAVVCPLSSATYFVTVTDAVGASATDSITIVPFPAPIINSGDTTICQSENPFFLSASPAGGTWSANGIDEDNEETGLYNPNIAGVAQDTVIYTDLNGCTDLIYIDIIELDIGSDDASCPGADSFYVSGGLPLGGTWSGPFIQSDGLFFPPDTAGVFIVTYDHPNGCTGSKTIYVDSISMPIIDTLCQSEASFLIPVTPFGGVWSGPGIVDADAGEFDPSEANPGENQLLYTINGCEDSLSIFIKEIDARNNLSACPEESPFILPGNWGPAGGIWSGLGIIDSLTGLYDPAILGNGANDTLTYTVDGCLDSRIVFVRQTVIQLNETLSFCQDEEVFPLDWDHTGRIPNGGIWSGPGTVNPIDNDWFFDPSLASPGTHVLYYEANTCIDSMSVIVYPNPVIVPEVVCEMEDPITLQANPPGGYWDGQGIVNNNIGTFDPQVAGGGNHLVTLESLNGCYAEGTVTVIPFETAMMDSLPEFFCYKDSNILIGVSPPGGQLTVNEVPASFFNPAQAGTGFHTIKYSIGQGACYSEVEQTVEVGSEITVSLPLERDTICFGESVSISADGDGGTNPGNYTYVWDNGLGFGKTHFVTPDITTTYTVSVSDGCSEASTASISILVHPQIQTSVTYGERVCFDDTTFASIQAFPAADYTYIWDSQPPTTGETIFSYPTSYFVDITNNETGCSIEEQVNLPGYAPITANFGLSPNVDCISSLEVPEVEILDFSDGGTSGYWDFGDGSPIEAYQEGANLRHIFPDSGTFTITLYIENSGNCSSEFQLDLCIKPEHRIFAPNALTPNLDGKNDIFMFKGIGVETISWQVFNRWGQMVFDGQSMDDYWDGTYKNNFVSPGVFTYIARYTTVYNPSEQILKGFVTVVY